jgi:hypothetical protein
MQLLLQKTSVADLSTYADSTFATKAYSDTTFATKTSVADLSTYADSTFATKAYSDATFATKTSVADLSTYADSTFATKTALGAVEASLISLTEQEALDVDYLQSQITELHDLSSLYAYESRVAELDANLSRFQLKGNYAYVTDFNNLADSLTNYQQKGVYALASDLDDTNDRLADYQPLGDYAQNSYVNSSFLRKIDAEINYAPASIIRLGRVAANLVAPHSVQTKTLSQATININTIVQKLVDNLPDAAEASTLYIILRDILYNAGTTYSTNADLHNIINAYVNSGVDASTIAENLVHDLANLNGGVHVSDIVDILSTNLDFAYAQSTEVIDNVASFTSSLEAELITSLEIIDNAALAQSIANLDSSMTSVQGSITNIQGQYATKAYVDNNFADVSKIGSVSLNAVNPLNADHSITAVIVDMNSVLTSTVASLSNYATLDVNHHILASNIPDLSATYIPTTSTVRFQPAGSYALQADLAAAQTQLNTMHNNLSNYASSSAVHDLTSSVNQYLGGSPAKYCITSDNGNTYTSVSQISSSFNNIPGQVLAWGLCSKWATEDQPKNLYITPTGSIDDCTLMGVADAFVYCVAATTFDR